MHKPHPKWPIVIDGENKKHLAAVLSPSYMETRHKSHLYSQTFSSA